MPTSPITKNREIIAHLSVGDQIIPGQRFTITSLVIAAADLDLETAWIAPAACKLISAQETHATAAGQAGTMQLERLAATDAPAAGTDMLATAFDLETTADTPVTQAALADGSEDIPAGERLALNLASGAATSLVGSYVTALLQWS